MSTITFAAAKTTPNDTGGIRMFESWVPLPVSGCTGTEADIAVLLRLLRLDTEDDCGAVSISVARRAVMVARATFDSMAPRLRRAGCNRAASPIVAVINGIHTIVQVRHVEAPLSVDDLASRLDRFAELVDAATAAGADVISWG